jgi:glycosyltransferase involved in cell wall biosynthesis
MNVVATLEHRFEQTPDGAVWTQTQYPHTFWAPYLDVFETVRVAARVKPVEKASPSWQRADDKRVTFAPAPCYVGPWQYLWRRGDVIRAARAAVKSDDAVILRVPGQLANCIEPMLRRTGHPYAVEVVADPYDVFAPGSVKHPLAPLFRWWSPRQLRRICRNACAASYVTREALQRRYPCPKESVGCSDVEISNASLVADARPELREPRRIRLITVGTLAQLYKAPHVLIDATAACIRQGLDLELVLIGDGKHRAELEAQGARLGVGERIHFRGQLTAGAVVRAELDRADVFVLPSFQEGLPRAMVEAMARGLPCVGSTVGGIPELLPADALVPPGDRAALAAKIRAVVTDPQRLRRMSRENLETARHYRAEILREKRVGFYQHVREQTAAWRAGQMGLTVYSPLSPCTQGERGRG